MPHISIKTYPGRSEEIKKDLAEKTKEFFMKEMDMEGKFFSISIEEVERENWQEEVVEKMNPDELYIEASF